MNGSWNGTYAGKTLEGIQTGGPIVIEIDDMGDHFEGSAYTFDATNNTINTLAAIKTPNKKRKITIEAPLFPLHPVTSEPLDLQQARNVFPDFRPTYAIVDIEWNEQELDSFWVTEFGEGTARIKRGKVSEASECIPLPVSDWEEFKRYVSQLKQFQFIYRGQKNTWRLRTPFHRTGRGDLRKFFFTQDVPALHRHLSARTNHLFDLNTPIQNAAFLNLVQHHGYPTPLLDWTYSPYVAAYFAYARIDPNTMEPNQKVRIFLFDRTAWLSNVNQILTIVNRLPHFTLVEPIAIENERLIPQQALSSLSTVDDIETYVSEIEARTKLKFLSVIDLPITERDIVLRELSLMGITAGAMFPGLDGTCEELRERFFPNLNPAVLTGEIPAQPEDEPLIATN